SSRRRLMPAAVGSNLEIRGRSSIVRVTMEAGSRLMQDEVSVVHEVIHGRAGHAGQHPDTGERVAAGGPLGGGLKRRRAAAVRQVHEVVRVRRPIDEAGESVMDIQLVSTGTRLEVLNGVPALSGQGMTDEGVAA